MGMYAHEIPSYCQRCFESKPSSLIMSRFNTDMICLACEAKEKAHPDYAIAVATEQAQVKQGNMNFEGIGKPADL